MESSKSTAPNVSNSVPLNLDENKTREILATKGNENFQTVRDVLDTVCTELLREYLRRDVPEKEFHKLLYDKDTKKKIKKNTNKDQKEILYPESGVFNGTYNEFDIALLYKLIRNWRGFPNHDTGWGNKPDDEDNSAPANIDRIRVLRNNYMHPTPVLKQLNDIEFEDVMKKLIFWIQGIEKTLSGKNTTFQDAAQTIVNEAKNHEKCKEASCREETEKNKTPKNEADELKADIVKVSFKPKGDQNAGSLKESVGNVPVTYQREEENQVQEEDNTGLEVDAIPTSTGNLTIQNKAAFEIHDALILHAKEDDVLGKQFHSDLLSNVKMTDLNVILYEEFAVGQTHCGSLEKLFKRCRYLLVVVTKNFERDRLMRYLNELAIIDSVLYREIEGRVIPVWAETGADLFIQALRPFKGIEYTPRSDFTEEEKSEVFGKFKKLFVSGKKYILSR